MLQRAWVWDVAIFTYGSCVFPFPDMTSGDPAQVAFTRSFIQNNVPIKKIDHKEWILTLTLE